MDQVLKKVSQAQLKSNQCQASIHLKAESCVDSESMFFAWVTSWFESFLAEPTWVVSWNETISWESTRIRSWLDPKLRQGKLIRLKKLSHTQICLLALSYLEPFGCPHICIVGDSADKSRTIPVHEWTHPTGFWQNLNWAYRAHAGLKKVVP